MARATFTDMQGGDDNFEDAFTDYVTVFNIRPAQCELLFPVVTVLSGYNTAISVTNPAYYGRNGVRRSDCSPSMGWGDLWVYDTTVDPALRSRIGSLTELFRRAALIRFWQVEILAAADWGETFQGHVHLRADYTNCSGLGWVTDWMGVNQAYTAVVVDADTGYRQVDLANCLNNPINQTDGPGKRGPFVSLTPKWS